MDRHLRGQTLEKGTRGKDRHTLGKMSRGPAKTAPPHPTHHFIRLPLSPQIVAPPGAEHYTTALKVAVQGDPGVGEGLGSSREAPSRPLILVGRCVAAGVLQAGSLEFSSGGRGSPL